MKLGFSQVLATYPLTKLSLSNPPVLIIIVVLTYHPSFQKLFKWKNRSVAVVGVIGE